MRAGQLNLPASPSLVSHAEEEIPGLRRKAGTSCGEGLLLPGMGTARDSRPLVSDPFLFARIWSEQEAASWGTREGSHKAGQ